MKNKLKLGEKEIEYTFKKNRRAKRMRLSIHCDGEIVITAPRFFNRRLAEFFLAQKTEWILDKLEYFKKFSHNYFFRNSRQDYLLHKEAARKLVEERIQYFNSTYDFRFNQIRIKNQKTCWGSCSRKGNLNFNYKIVFLPPDIADYIIVHELCHLQEFNHSQKFWRLVEMTVPDHRLIRRKLHEGEFHRQA